MKKAILESTELLDKEDQYDQIVQIIKKAICTGTSPTCGLDFNNDVAARYSETFRNTIATGIQQLDSREILNGGLGSGELGIVIAISGVGKSHVLVQMGAQAMSQGKNVVHYTLELNERATGVRYDSHILGINSTDCKDNLPEILRFYQDNAGSLGRLFIKHLPPRTSTTNTIRAHIDRLYNKDIKPDLIVVDYAGIMKPTEKHSEVRFNLQQIVQDLKDLSEELQVPLWTAIQSNKEGASSEFIDITNMAEAFGQSFAADFVMGLSRKAENKSTGFGSLFLAKNRAGLDGILYKIHLDTARSRLRILSSVEAEELKEMSQKISASMADPSGQTIKSYKNTVSNNKNLFNKAVGGSR
jgi:replicative DNA helicase